MTSLDSLLLSSFEDWAEAYWGQGLNCEWDSEVGAFTDSIVNVTWESYKAATRTILESLVLGVEATREGAAVCLMVKLKDTTLVIKSEYVVADKPVYGRVV